MRRAQLLFIASTITLLFESLPSYAQTMPVPGMWTISSSTYLAPRSNADGASSWPDEPRTACMSLLELKPSIFLDAQKISKKLARDDEHCEISEYKSEVRKASWKMLCKKSGEESRRTQFEVRLSATEIYSKIIDSTKDQISGDIDVIHEDIYKRDGDCDESRVKRRK
jgi:hypothetical protein